MTIHHRKSAQNRIGLSKEEMTGTSLAGDIDFPSGPARNGW
jgi:hypothetical protein